MARVGCLDLNLDRIRVLGHKAIADEMSKIEPVVNNLLGAVSDLAGAGARMTPGGEWVIVPWEGDNWINVNDGAHTISLVGPYNPTAHTGSAGQFLNSLTYDAKGLVAATGWATPAGSTYISGNEWIAVGSSPNTISHDSPTAPSLTPWPPAGEVPDAYIKALSRDDQYHMRTYQIGYVNYYVDAGDWLEKLYSNITGITTISHITATTASEVVGYVKAGGGNGTLTFEDGHLIGSS